MNTRQIATHWFGVLCGLLILAAPNLAVAQLIPAPTVNISLDKSSVVLGTGGTTLRWSTVNATSCSSSGAWSGGRGTSGSVRIDPPAEGTYSYNLSCVGPGGTTANSATLTVEPPPPSITLTIDPTIIIPGTSGTLTWSTTRADSCTASGGWSGSKPSSGTQTITPASTATYTLSCTGPGGSYSKSVTGTVGYPSPGLSFTTSATAIPVGGSAALTWSTTNATECTASSAWSGSKGPSGSETVNPSGSGTYTISCTGPGGTVKRSIAISVVQPPTLTLGASPPSIDRGQTTSITWSTTNVDSCTASGGWTGLKSRSGTFTASPTVDTTYTLTCAGVGGSVTRSVTVPVAQVPIITFSASPVSIGAGASSVLSWSVTDATSCTASGGWSGGKAASGSDAVNPTETTTYTLSCSNANGTSSRSITITVIGAPTLEFTTPNLSITRGSTARLTWTSTNATTCSASGGWSGTKGTAGSVVVTPTETTTYVLACTGPAGSVSQSLTITVTLGPSVNLTVSPTTVASGGSATLSWSTGSGTLSCVASGGWSGTKAVSGSQVVNPTVTTTYSLECSNSTASTLRSVTVTVTPPPVITFSASPTTVEPGGTSTLTWSSTGATSCSGSGGWSGSKAVAGGSSAVTLTATTTFVLSCTGAGGTATQSVTVTVEAPQPTLTFTGTPTSITPPSSATLNWTATNATSCTASGGWSSSKPLTGSQTVTPTSTTTYTLTCNGGAGTTPVVRSVTIEVLAAPTLSFTASPASIPRGSSSTLTWATSNADSCSAPWTSITLANGSEVVSPVGTTTYTLTCTGGGGTVSRTVTVTVTDPTPTLTLTANPTSVPGGGTTPSTLTWSSANVTACTASGGWTGVKALEGSQDVTPTATTTYSMTCTSAAGQSVTRSATVSVTPPPTLTLTANPTAVGPGIPSVLTWTTTNATSCSAPWVDTSTTAGAQTVNPTETTTYSMTCVGTSGTVTRSVVVTYYPSAPGLTLTASATNVVAGRTFTLTWAVTNSPVTCSASGAWTGSKTITGATQTITSSTTPGTYLYSMTCTNPAGSVTRSVNINVTENTPPTISGTPSAVAPVGVLYSFTPTASDRESSSLGFRITGRPAWASFSTTTGRLSGTPSASHVGTYSNIVISASDGVNSVALPPFTITVTNESALTLTLSANPTTIMAGGTSNLTWTSTQATECIASGAWSGSRSLSGNISINPASTRTYTLACSSATGATVTKSVTITVTEITPTLTFTASPTSVPSGGTTPVTLTWESGNAATCTASGGWTGPKSLSGTATVTPTSSTTYTLVCRNEAGTKSATRSVSVTVIPPPTLTLTASPTSIAVGEFANLRWSTTNATSCIASGAWSGSRSLSGNISVNPATTRTYTLACTGVSGSVTREVTITVGGSVPVVTLTAGATSVVAGRTFALTWTTSGASSCTASGSWSGTKPLIGSQSITSSKAPGTYTYNLACTNPVGTTTRSVTITVTENTPPTITGTPSPYAFLSQLYSFVPMASDRESPSVGLSIRNRPIWANFNTTTGELSGTPSASHVGVTYRDIVITASDGVNTTSLPAFTITVYSSALGSARVSWTPPTQNIDDTPLTNLAGFKVYYWRSGGAERVLQLPSASFTSVELENLEPGTWNFEVTAYNALNAESDRSNRATKTIL
jgi:trimeric autotransporter adhesin